MITVDNAPKIVKLQYLKKRWMNLGLGKNLIVIA